MQEAARHDDDDNDDDDGDDHDDDDGDGDVVMVFYRTTLTRLTTRFTRLGTTPRMLHR
jgi:hypothetical protein